MLTKFKIKNDSNRKKTNSNSLSFINPPFFENLFLLIEQLKLKVCSLAFREFWENHLQLTKCHTPVKSWVGCIISLFHPSRNPCIFTICCCSCWTCPIWFSPPPDYLGSQKDLSKFFSCPKQFWPKKKSVKNVDPIFFLNNFFDQNFLKAKKR